MGLDQFPLDKLKNVISLASPILEPPQFLTNDLTRTLEEIEKNALPETASYFHFDGGIRDVFAGQGFAKNKGVLASSVVRDF